MMPSLNHLSVLFCGLLVLANSTTATSTTEDTCDTCSRAVPMCQEERTLRVGSEGWGDPATYRPADEIVPGLWLGNVCAAMNESFILEHNIKLVIGMAKEWPFEGIVPNGARYEHFSLEDSGSESLVSVKIGLELASHAIITFYEEQTMYSSPGKFTPIAGVLVYCNMGISRSTTAVMYTLMNMIASEYPSTYEDYLDLVQHKRPVANPNPQYRGILVDRLAAKRNKGEL